MEGRGAQSAAPWSLAPRSALTTAVVGLFVIFAAAALWAGREVFIPIALAILLSYALQPLQRALLRWHLPGTLAAALIVGALLAGSLGSIYGLRSQVTAFVGDLPHAFHRLGTVLQQPHTAGGETVSRMRDAARELAQLSANAAEPPPAPRGVTRVQVEGTPVTVTDLMWRTTGGAITFAAQAFVVVVLVFYFLAADDMYKRKLVKIAGDTLAEKRLTVEILHDIERHIARYLAARLLISVIVCVATAAAFWWLAMPEPAAWGIIAGVLNIVPYVGPIAVTVGAGAAAFLHTGAAAHAFWVMVIEAGINTLEGFVLTPVLMGRAGRMNGAAVFIALTVWGFLWGLWGLLLAVPITMALKVLCDHVDAFAPLGELLGD